MDVESAEGRNVYCNRSQIFKVLSGQVEEYVMYHPPIASRYDNVGRTVWRHQVFEPTLFSGIFGSNLMSENETGHTDREYDILINACPV